MFSLSSQSQNHFIEFGGDGGDTIRQILTCLYLLAGKTGFF